MGIVKRTEEGNIDFDHLIVPLGKREYCLVVPYLRQEDYPESDAYAEGVQVMYRELLIHYLCRTKVNFSL